MGRTNEKNVGGDIPIRYKIITKSFTRQIVPRYSLKTNVNQEKKIPAYHGSIHDFKIKLFLCQR